MNFILFLMIVAASISIHSCQLNQECRPELDVDFRNVRDISFQRANDFQDCCRLCSNDQNPTVANRCQIWTFVLETKVCWFKVGTPTRLSSSGRVSGIRSTAPVTSTTSVCAINQNFIYPGGDLVGANMNSATDCCNFCGRTPGCVAWDFLSQFCFLKNRSPTLDRRVVFQGASSGVLVR